MTPLEGRSQSSAFRRLKMTSATSDAGTTTGARHNKQRRATTSRGVSALMYAAQQGDVARVKRIVQEQPTSLLTRDRTGKTPLHYCCTSDNICAAQAADLLVMAAPDLVDSRDEDGFTPLHLAAIAGNMPLVTFLLANKADVNAVDNEKHTVVHWATVCGETAALRAVLAAGAPVSTPDVHGGYPLHYAAQMCGGEKDSNLGLQVLQTLLTHTDIVVSVEDGDGRQPLLWAASAGSAKAVLALVRAGAAVEAPDKDGLTALHCAASRGHTDCIDTLLTLCGASPDVIDSNGCTALHYAVTLGHADATALLLAHGADPNRQDRKGRTPAHCGCAKGQFETVKMIGARGANLWLRNARGDLPLHEAAASGRRDLVRWLLDIRPSQVNARNNDGRCPLHLAALNDNADMCKILLDAGAQINPVLRTSKNTFMTPLDCALQRGFRSTAKYLQLHGGVPANRLGDVRHNQTNAGVNLQIKDDVTFWGDTSSDSERENGEVTKHSKSRIQRKKLSHKFDKKRASLSGSDVENSKLIGKVEGGRSSRRKFGEKQRRVSARTESATSVEASKNTHRKTSSRIDYTNEIVINGKTEINIHNSKQTNVTTEEVATQVPSTLSTEIAEKVLSEVPVEKDKRPKSAKSVKARDKSGKSGKEDSAKRKTKIERPNSKQKQGNIEQSKQEVGEEKSLLIESNRKVDLANVTAVEETRTIKPPKLPDQQSLMSNTSEEVEEHKSLVVEAAVHEPPKTAQQEETVKEVQIETTKQQLATEEKEGEENEADGEKLDAKENDVEKQEEVTKELEEVSKSSATERDKIELTGGQSEHTDNEVKEKEDLVPEETTDKVSLEETTEKVTLEETTEKVTLEETTEKVTLEETTEKVTLEEKIEETTLKEAVKNTTPTEEVEATTVEKRDEEETVADKNVESTDANHIDHKESVGETPLQADASTTNLEVNKEKSKEETKAAVSQNETEKIPQQPSSQNTPEGVENKEDMSSAKSKGEEESETGTVEDKDVKDSSTKETTEEISTDKLQSTADETSTKKRKSKRKLMKKKRHPTDDQAYEIIYKTMGAEEDEDEALERLSNREEKLKKSLSGSKSSENEYSTDLESESSTSTSLTVKEHKSFRILDDKEAEELETKKTKTKKISRKTKVPLKKQRSRSEESKQEKSIKESDKIKKSKVPKSLSKSQLSKSDKYLNIPDGKIKSSMESRVPSLPNIHENKDKIKEPPRSDSNMSAPLLASAYSDEEVSASEAEAEEEEEEKSSARRKRIKKKSKTREARSAGSDYESSNVIDSGFEPSPRSSRIPKWKNMSDRGVNMTSVTQSIQTNIRRYHLERKIFQHLLDLKRLQIRAGQHNEAILVKRAIDAYHQSCASTVGAGRYVPEDYSFKSFEKFLYLSLRKLQRNGADHLKGLPESPANPLLCTQSTHRCMHATHAYTGIPCAAYLPKMDHHTISKIGFTSTQCKPGTGFLPTINPKKAVTLELCHGNDKQVISLPADRLDHNKRYYVTFTVKGNEETVPNEDTTTSGHRHSKSD